MVFARRGIGGRAIIASLVSFAAISGIALGGLAAVRGGLVGRDRLVGPRGEGSLARRLAAVDEALARGDVTQAIYRWRDAYGAALRSRRWDAMVAVGDAARRIDALARPDGVPSGFRAEARQAYLQALFRARAAASPEGLARAAEAFAALGDAEMAAQARTIAAAR
jgi:hypothetical protein